MRRIFAVLALAAFAAPAAACINDSALPKYETEFRSQYRSTTPPAPASSSSDHQFLMYGAGSALLIGATVMTVRRRAG